MMMRYLVLLLVLPLSAGAQEKPRTRYASQCLEQLAATLENSPLNPSKGTAPLNPPQGGTNVTVERNAQGVIDHIGFQLFTPQVMAEAPSPVYHFVERYLLELYLTESQTEIERRLKEDKVKITAPLNPPNTAPLNPPKGGTSHDTNSNNSLPFGEVGGASGSEGLRERLAAVLPRIAKNKGQGLMILTSDNRYTVSFYDGDKPLLSLRFPIQYELLWGMGKKEVEAKFYEGLMNYSNTAPLNTAPLNPPKGGTPDTANSNISLPFGEVGGAVSSPFGGVEGANGLYAYVGDSYAIDAMNDTRYYRKQADGSFRLVCESDFPEESVRNLFLCPDSFSVEAEVTQYLYGRKRHSFSVPLAQLMGYCREMGCRTYVGIETVDERKVTGTAILQNISHGYCHLLYFETGTDMPPDSVKISLYAYVPTHNLIM